MLDTLLTVFSTRIGLGEIALRMSTALVLGAVVGFDREYLHRPAGLRTHMVVSLAAATFTIIAFEMFNTVQASADEPTADVIRVIEAVTAGVAFLAAGTIIRRDGGGVLGLTTGAGLWLAGAIGLACGAGFYTIAVLGTVGAVMVLVIVRLITRAVLDKKQPAPPTAD